MIAYRTVAKKLNSKSRVFLPPRIRSGYFISAQKNLNLSQKEFSKILGISTRTFTEWKSGSGSFPLSATKIIKKRAEITLPKEAKIETNPFWYTLKGAPLGGKAVHKLYGNNFSNTAYRRKQWLLWWQEKGQYKSAIIGKKKEINLPKFSKELAEFTGIMLGDGGIAKYQIVITLNKIDDSLYADYVKNLIKKLFKVTASRIIVKNVKALNIIVSRIDLVVFCNKTLGLPIGDKIKQGLDIPQWILANDTFLKHCVRGLVDTDGSVFWEKHKSNEKYSYPRLNFTSASPLLIQSFFNTLVKFGFNPKLRRNGRAVQIEKKEEICKYWKIIGSSNPKHKKKLLVIWDGCESGLIGQS